LIAMTLDTAGGALGDFDLHQRSDGFLSRPALDAERLTPPPKGA
jgi:hypothetical protein